MDTIKEWALLVAGCAIFIEFCAMLLPKGESGKTGMLVLGLVMVVALLLPMGDFYQKLQEIDFSYETERNQVTEQFETYTEDQMLEVTKEYKQRLTEYMCQLVNEVEGIEDCHVDFMMEEDYRLETYGIVKRIYVTAYPRVEKTEEHNSGFSQMAPIQKIEITLEGITVITQEETEEKDATDPRTKEICKVLQEAFQLEEDCIFVEVKDE